ncbi:metallophosphoesterase [Azospirillum halopraeferens]|uniref:metallophosphoesterase n=1 Tax=Azospirillum halopraeferens TaxID=34010 RepID=UPI0003FB0864|nr:metallophosphoesterase [Azospirillum halopraeferens]
MPRIAVFSDLHLEFGDLPNPNVTADVVVLAGDVYTKNRAWKGDSAEAFFGCPVVAVAGNHEFYSGHIDTALAKTKAAAAAKGITLLEREELVLAGTRFLGCTLWSDFRLFAADDLTRVKADASLCVGDRYSGGLNDFRCIRVAKDGYRRFRPLDAATLHAASVAWLDARLAEPFDGPTVVVTHHAPSLKCVPEAWLDDCRTAAYASDLGWLIDKHQPAAWCYGHIHENVPAFQLGKTVMVSNPRGYYPRHLNPNFRPDLVIEVS